MRALLFLSFVSCVAALRKGQRSQWSTVSDKTHGMCAENMQYIQKDPVGFPLLCSGEATNVTIAATAYGIFSSKMWVKVDGESKGDRRWPVFGGTRTFHVTLDRLSKGLHNVHFRSWGRIDFKSVTVTGGGTACTLEEASNFGRDLSSYTLNGFDVLNRLFEDNGDRNFDQFKKQQVNFATETVGTNEDGSIKATVVAEGFWKWMYMFSQEKLPDDAWDRWGRKPHGLWEEAKNYPHPNISLGFMPRHAGQLMTVYEPCNTLSNLAYHEAGIWIGCKGWPFDRDEMASLVAAFHALGGGSAFLHACACLTGGRSDSFAMDWLMLQAYQSLVRDVVNNAGEHLTEEERNAILYFNKPPMNAIDVAKNMTRLFEGKYDHEFWNATMRAVNIAPYEMPITGVISFVVWGLADKFPVPGLGSLLKSVLDALLGVFNIPDGEFITQLYWPAIRKALSYSNICFDKVMDVGEHTLAFIVTFVEAIVFQEKKIPVPKAFREVVGFMDRMGWTSDQLNVMHSTWDYYNGKDCRRRSDHATWHEKAAQGLIHFLEVANEYRKEPLC